MILFLDIDTQKDFMLPGGALYVPGAEEIIPVIKRLTGFAGRNNIPLLSSVDAHEPDDPEFRDFPPHCVSNTPGQSKIPESLLDEYLVAGQAPADGASFTRHRQIIIEKTNLDLFSNPNTEIILKELNPGLIYLYGVATDYCVGIAAQGAMKRSFNVTLISDAIRGISKDNTEKIVTEIKVMGGMFISSEELLSRE